MRLQTYAPPLGFGQEVAAEFGMGSVEKGGWDGLHTKERDPAERRDGFLPHRRVTLTLVVGLRAKSCGAVRHHPLVVGSLAFACALRQVIPPLPADGHRGALNDGTKAK